MVTLNVREFDGQKRLLGSINKQPFNVPYTTEAKDELLSFGEQMDDAETVIAFNLLVDGAMAYIETVSVSNIVEVAGTDLMHDKAKNQYFLKGQGKTSKIPVHPSIVARIQKAVDLGLSPKPWVKFWTRLLRNKQLTVSKTRYIMAYMSAPFTDKEKYELLLKDGYAADIAKEIATFDQISISKEGLVAAFKYVQLKDTTKHVEIDKETGEQKVVKTKQSLHGKSSVAIDDNDNVVKTKGEAFMAEELIFVPPVMGDGGEAFTCEPLVEGNKFEDYSAHVIRVGKRHRLKGWSSVNCTDGYSGVKGLHVGGYHYVQGFGGRTELLVDCLVDPAHIGAITDDLSSNTYRDDAAMRVLEYYVTGTHFAVNKSMYHPSAYAELLDKEWEKFKDEAIEAADKNLGEITEW